MIKDHKRNLETKWKLKKEGNKIIILLIIKKLIFFF